MVNPVEENVNMQGESTMIQQNRCCDSSTSESDMIITSTTSDLMSTSHETIPEMGTISKCDIDPTELNEFKHSMKESRVEVTNKTSALMNLMEYNDEEDDEWTDFSTDPRPEEIFVSHQESRKPRHSESSESDSESDISERIESKEIDSDVELVSDGNLNNNRHLERQSEDYLNVYGETLPPVADLSNLVINDNDDFLHIGNVYSIVDTVVTISSLPNSPAYDLETVLFIEKESRKIPLGEIFDVIGPVSSPFYCVQLKSGSDIKEKEIESGVTKVFSIPQGSRTHYIFVKQLMEAKYTDASGENDEEVVGGSSDDENLSETPTRNKKKRTNDQMQTGRTLNNVLPSNTQQTPAERIQAVKDLIQRIPQTGPPQASAFLNAMFGSFVNQNSFGLPQAVLSSFLPPNFRPSFYRLPNSQSSQNPQQSQNSQPSQNPQPPQSTLPYQIPQPFQNPRQFHNQSRHRPPRNPRFRNPRVPTATNRNPLQVGGPSPAQMVHSFHGEQYNPSNERIFWPPQSQSSGPAPMDHHLFGNPQMSYSQRFQMHQTGYGNMDNFQHFGMPYATNFTHGNPINPPQTTPSVPGPVPPRGVIRPPARPRP